MSQITGIGQMGNRDQIRSVISPLQAKRAPKGWARMIEESKSFARTREFNTIGTWYSAVGVTLGLIIALVGWLTTGNNNSKDIQTLQSQQASSQLERANDRKEYQDQLKAIISQNQMQVSAISTQISDLAKQMPSAYQLSEFAKHLSAIDGRLDAVEHRQNDDEQNQIRTQTQMEIIRNSSDAQLKGHVH